MDNNSPQLKLSYKCGHEFTPENTYFHKKSGSSFCRTCKRANEARQRNTETRRLYMRGHRAKWRERNPDYHKNNWLMGAYGISLEDMQTMLAEQGGYCAICGEELKEPHVDHDHFTGKIRALLCTSCNAGLGSFHDSPSVLLAAMSYLEEHRCPKIL